LSLREEPSVENKENEERLYKLLKEAQGERNKQINTLDNYILKEQYATIASSGKSNTLLLKNADQSIREGSQPKVYNSRPDDRKSATLKFQRNN